MTGRVGRGRVGLKYACAKGLTLIEVLIATAIMAVIGAISYQSLSASILSKEVVEDNLLKLNRVDRIWMLLETDLRNLVPVEQRQVFGAGSGEAIPAFVADPSATQYWLTLLRGGHANPLHFPRTEMIRVGYRVQDETLWRDVWYDLASVDSEQARPQKIVEHVESIEVRLLPHTATSYSDGPWVDRWPAPNLPQAGSKLPLAIEVTLKLDGYSEITRLFALVKGE